MSLEPHMLTAIKSQDISVSLCHWLLVDDPTRPLSNNFRESLFALALMISALIMASESCLKCFVIYNLSDHTPIITLLPIIWLSTDVFSEEVKSMTLIIIEIYMAIQKFGVSYICFIKLKKSIKGCNYLIKKYSRNWIIIAIKNWGSRCSNG